MLNLPQHTYRFRKLNFGAVEASCRDVECEAWKNGFILPIDERTVLGKNQAKYLRSRECGRDHVEKHRANGITEFIFPVGTYCFVQHKVRPEQFLTRIENHNSVVVGAEQWAYEFQETTELIAEKIKEG